VSQTVAAIRIRRLPIGEIKPHPRNPRTHPKPGSPVWKVLLRSVEHDYFDPLVWNERTGYLVSGHFRLKVMESIGITEIDVSVVDYDEPTHYARMIAANKNTGWDDDGCLAALIDDIKADVDPVLAMLENFDQPVQKKRKAKPVTEINEVFEIIVECTGEDQQRQLFDRFREEGIKCRLLTL